MANKIHKGLRTYTGDELGNLALGQAGFDIIDGSVTESISQGDYWVAFKVVNGAANVCADIHSEFPGDNFSDDGNTIASGSGGISCEDGEMVYGCFVRIKLHSAANIVVAYRG